MSEQDEWSEHVEQGVEGALDAAEEATQEAATNDAAQEPGEKIVDLADKGVDTDNATENAVDQFGETLLKAATDTAYATVGLVGLLSEKAKEFYAEQKRQYAETHPEAERDTGGSEFLSQLREQVDRFVDDLGRGFKDLVERGRDGAKDSPEAAGSDVADDLEAVADKGVEVLADPPVVEPRDEMNDLR